MVSIKYINTINVPYFIMAFITGYIIAQLIIKPTKTVIRYNNIKNERGKLVYETTDSNGKKCYNYVTEEIKCPNSSEVLDHPIVYTK